MNCEKCGNELKKKKFSSLLVCAECRGLFRPVEYLNEKGNIPNYPLTISVVIAFIILSSALRQTLNPINHWYSLITTGVLGAIMACVIYRKTPRLVPTKYILITANELKVRKQDILIFKIIVLLTIGALLFLVL
jgi:hypothetical protein